MEKLTFVTNRPIVLALRSLEGEEVESQFGGTQHKFQSDKGPFWVSRAAGKIITEQLQKLDIEPGQSVEICKAEIDAGRGRKSLQWLVAVPVEGEVRAENNSTCNRVSRSKSDFNEAARSNECSTGEQQNGTFALPKPPAKKTVNSNVVSMPAAEKPAEVPARPRWAEVLIAQTNVLVDAYAASLQHASQHNGAIRPDTVQSLMITAFINLSKNGGSSHA